MTAGPFEVTSGERGRTTVDRRVVEVVAVAAVLQVGTVTATPSPEVALTSRIGAPPPQDAESPTVAPRRGARSASVAVKLVATTAVPPLQTASDVAERVRTDVENYTGVLVDHVDVRITAFVPAPVAAGSQLRTDPIAVAGPTGRAHAEPDTASTVRHAEPDTASTVRHAEPDTASTVRHAEPGTPSTELVVPWVAP